MTKPYHLFRVKDSRFVFHRGAGRFIRVKPEAYELLRLRGEMSAGEAKSAFLARYPGLDGVIAEVDALEADGFFEPVGSSLSDAAGFETELAARIRGTSNNIVLSVASGCNLACTYCYCGVCRDEIPDQGLMSEETAMRAIDAFLAAADTQTDIGITFFGGEPLLNKKVIRKVVERCNAWAADNGVKAGYSITTNATLMDDETARLIADNGFGLMVSLDGPKELHDGQCPARSGGGSFDLAMAGIQVLKKYRTGVTVRCTMAHPAPDAMKLIRFFKDSGFARVVLGTVSNPTFPSDRDFTPEDNRVFERCVEDEIIPWMLGERAEGRVPVYDPFDDIDDFLCEKEHPQKEHGFRCGACRGATAVGPDGTFYPCHRFVGMRAWAIGSLDSGLDREKCGNFWRAHRAASEKSCGSCWAHRVCKGPCPWEIARSDGTFTAPSRICDETRTWIEQGVYYHDQAERLGLNARKEPER